MKALPSKTHKTCGIEGCGKKHRARGLCNMHYLQARRAGEDANLPHDVFGYHDKVCVIEDCEKKHVALGYCRYHWYRFHTYGDPLVSKRAPDGAGWIIDGGYKMVSYNGKRYLEHRLVMERHLGRELLKTEQIHHMNGDRLDNRLDNLELWSTYQPIGQRVIDLVAWAKEIVARYERENG
jgi:hypothetical protein